MTLFASKLRLTYYSSIGLEKIKLVRLEFHLQDCPVLFQVLCNLVSNAPAISEAAESNFAVISFSISAILSVTTVSASFFPQSDLYPPAKTLGEPDPDALGTKRNR